MRSARSTPSTNRFSIHSLPPKHPSYLALSTVAFLLFVGVLVVLVRNLLKLYANQRSRVLGTRLRTRMLWGAVLVSLVPLAFMFAFSYLLMNRAVDRWFSQPVTEMRDDADGMLSALTHYAGANARLQADALALELADTPLFRTPAPKRTESRHDLSDLTAIHRVLEAHQLALQGGFALLYRDNYPIASFHLPESAAPAGAAPTSALAHAIFQSAQTNEAPLMRLGTTDFSLAAASLRNGGLRGRRPALPA